MEYLLFVTYLVLVAWLVTKIPFFKRSGLNESQLVIVFLLKVITGIFYGWIGIFYSDLAKMEDTWALHVEGIREYHLLFDHPREYFNNLFRSSYESGYGGYFSGHDSYWNDLKGNFLIKILSLFNIFSFGNYYINVIFYSFISLTGPIALFRVMTVVYPGKKLIVLLATFLVPSFLFWSSGIHKEGLIFTAISLIMFHLFFSLSEKRFRFSRLIPVLISLLILLIFRNFLLVLILLAVTPWVLCYWFPAKPARVFLLIYTVAGISFFTLRYLNPRLDFPRAVVNKQQEFLDLVGGNSTIPMSKLSPDVLSFIKSAPRAFFSTIARPLPGDVRHILSLAACTEVYLLLFIGFLALYLRAGPIRLTPFLLFCLFFAFSVLLAIGFTVNNLGAIARYRSVVIPLLLVPAVCSVNWEKFWSSLKNIVNNNNI